MPVDPQKILNQYLQYAKQLFANYKNDMDTLEKSERAYAKELLETTEKGKMLKIYKKIDNIEDK
ncbi:MAG: hypothetical protein COV59_01075 [Candidatus Magasanikbacteria bacterium CG11_big_fil_rev_8_21_14_0_20_39_34]|uniref:Uncharacterized protein n=1 Tax=Candidatus Magasanikbacteria bacterium CG11_big_fil_rev_8_21_14_0_20_39_34 TaxID=1974653 RepID=A0A2H0N6A6_9BACT|nr:MAG: hypothetical protein COV59_01075 [Candidatus Magasanikbacteria bacterium CG11_big_fil_rev_8_21_14_0_20_39_34]